MKYFDIIIKYFKFQKDKKRMLYEYNKTRTELNVSVSKCNDILKKTQELPPELTGDLLEKLTQAKTLGERCISRTDAIIDALSNDRIEYLKGLAAAVETDTNKYSALTSEINADFQKMRTIDTRKMKGEQLC